MQENLVVKKATPLGARVWTSLLVFGFIGQIAWMVEKTRTMITFPPMASS